MKKFNGDRKTELLKAVAKSVCAGFAVFSLMAFAGCDINTPNGENNNPPSGDENTLPQVPEGAEKDGYTFVWSDEFDGDSLDLTKWSYQTGTRDTYGEGGPENWGNKELQYYSEDNVTVSSGLLTITAKRENKGEKQFTSGRITSRGKFTTTYGYIEAKIKSPAIEGMWPAFWMLPQPTDTTSSHNVYGGWPNNGEIDIMEAKGRLKNEVDCTLHYGNTSKQHEYDGKSKKLGSNIDRWHTFALDWTPDYIAWIIDGEEFYRMESSRWWTGSSNEQSAPFDQPFYILLNLAVGGQYDGGKVPPESFTEADMSIDYVRVYEKTETEEV